MMRHWWFGRGVPSPFWFRLLTFGAVVAGALVTAALDLSPVAGGAAGFIAVVVVQAAAERLGRRRDRRHAADADAHADDRGRPPGRER